MTSDNCLTSKLDYSFGPQQVLFDIDISIKKGDIYGLVGPNGAGKTTLLKCVLGLLPTAKGTIRLFDQIDLDKGRENIGALIAPPSFYEELSAQRNLELYQQYTGRSKEQIPQILSDVGLLAHKDQAVENFSLGMRQRLGIARALLNNPTLLILDEPTNGLDPQGIQEIRRLLQQLNTEQNMTILLSSHLLSEIEQICNQIAILSNGRIQYDGSVDALRQTEPRYRIDAENRVALRAAIRHQGIQIIEEDIEGFIISLPTSNMADVNRICHQESISLNRIEAITQSLEDSFLALTGKSHD